MLRSAYKHFSCLNLAEVTSKNDSKLFKVAPLTMVNIALENSTNLWLYFNTLGILQNIGYTLILDWYKIEGT